MRSKLWLASCLRLLACPAAIYGLASHTFLQVCTLQHCLHAHKEEVNTESVHSRYKSQAMYNLTMMSHPPIA